MSEFARRVSITKLFVLDRVRHALDPRVVDNRYMVWALVATGCLVGCKHERTQTPPSPSVEPAPATSPATPAAPATPPSYARASSCDLERVFAGQTGDTYARPDDVHDYDECDFYEFGWAGFLAATSPSSTPDRLVFETFTDKIELFKPVTFAATQTACGTQAGGPNEGARVVGAVASDAQLPGVGFPNGPVQISFAYAPMTDESGRWVYNESRVSDESSTFVTACGLASSSCFDSLAAQCASDHSTAVEFPAGTVHVKPTWKVIDPKADAGHDFYTMEAFVAPGARGELASCSATEQTLGLVGLHVVQKTPNHPEWIWATFEHVAVAPDCWPAEDAAADDWLFHDANSGRQPNVFASGCADAQPATTCALDPDHEPGTQFFACDEGQLVDVPGVDAHGEPNGQTLAYTGNCWDADQLVFATPLADDFGFAKTRDNCYDDSRRGGSGRRGQECRNVPTQACRHYPIGYLGESVEIDGEQTKVDPRLSRLNAAVQAKLGDSVWKNYRLVGASWFHPSPGDSGGAVSVDWCDAEDVANDVPRCSAIGEAANARAGSYDNANMTLETFIQGAHNEGEGVGSGCWFCHSPTYQAGGGLGGPFVGVRRADFAQIFGQMEASSNNCSTARQTDAAKAALAKLEAEYGGSCPQPVFCGEG